MPKLDLLFFWSIRGTTVGVSPVEKKKNLSYRNKRFSFPVGKEIQNDWWVLYIIHHGHEEYSKLSYYETVSETPKNRPVYEPTFR